MERTTSLSSGSKKSVSGAERFQPDCWHTCSSAPQLTAVDLRSHALLISQGNSRADDWAAAISQGLGEQADDYTRVRIFGPNEDVEAYG